MSAQDEILATLAHYMEFWNSKDLDGFMGIFAEDVAYAYEGEGPSSGKAAVKNSIKKAWSSQPSTAFQKNFLVDDLGQNLALTMNIYDYVNESGNVIRQGALKDMSIWKKADGKWVIWRDSMSSSTK